jgi:hypothetical protein
MTAGWRRAQAAAGLAGIVMVAAGLGLPGRPPRTSDAAANVTRSLLDHREAFLASSYVIGIGALLLLLFLGSLHARLVTGAEPLASASFGAGLVAVGLLMTGTATVDGLVFTAAGMHDPAVVRALMDASNAQFAMAGLAFAALLLASSAAGVLPRPLRMLGYAGAAYLVFTRLTLAVDSGPLEAGGAVDLSSTVPLVVWIGSASVLLIRSSG